MGPKTWLASLKNSNEFRNNRRLESTDGPGENVAT